MNKRITTAVTYELPIKDLDYVKEFVYKLHEISEELNKKIYNRCVNSCKKNAFISAHDEPRILA